MYTYCTSQVHFHVVLTNQQNDFSQLIFHIHHYHNHVWHSRNRSLHQGRALPWPKGSVQDKLLNFL